jgi:hypothetical protein
MAGVATGHLSERQRKRIRWFLRGPQRDDDTLRRIRGWTGHERHVQPLSIRPPDRPAVLAEAL